MARLVPFWKCLARDWKLPNQTFDCPWIIVFYFKRGMAVREEDVLGNRLR